MGSTQSEGYAQAVQEGSASLRQAVSANLGEQPKQYEAHHDPRSDCAPRSGIGSRSGESSESSYPS